MYVHLFCTIVRVYIYAVSVQYLCIENQRDGITRMRGYNWSVATGFGLELLRLLWCQRATAIAFLFIHIFVISRKVKFCLLKNDAPNIR